MIETANGEIKEKIIGFLTSLFSDSGVDTDIFEYVDLIDDLGMDSINFVSLIIELEATFDVQIPDEWLLMEKFRTFSQIYSAVYVLINEKGTGTSNAGQ